METFSQQMAATGQHPRVIEEFARLYQHYLTGDPGQLRWSGVRAPGHGDLLPYENLRPEDSTRGKELLGKLVVISLNGGLGTTMKLARTKSLIPVRDGMSFLEIKARQLLELRKSSGHEIPWLLMNSFHTRDDTLCQLAEIPKLRVQDLPLDFLEKPHALHDVRCGLPKFVAYGRHVFRRSPQGPQHRLSLFCACHDSVGHLLGDVSAQPQFVDQGLHAVGHFSERGQGFARVLVRLVHGLVDIFKG